MTWRWSDCGSLKWGWKFSKANQSSAALWLARFLSGIYKSGSLSPDKRRADRLNVNPSSPFQHFNIAGPSCCHHDRSYHRSLAVVTMRSSLSRGLIRHSREHQSCNLDVGFGMLLYNDWWDAFSNSVNILLGAIMRYIGWEWIRSFRSTSLLPSSSYWNLGWAPDADSSFSSFLSCGWTTKTAVRKVSRWRFFWYGWLEMSQIFLVCHATTGFGLRLFLWPLLILISGALWAGLVPTVIATAAYFCLSDGVLILQCFYYNEWARKREEKPTDPETHSATEESPLIRQTLRRQTSAGLPGANRRLSNLSETGPSFLDGFVEAEDGASVHDYSPEAGYLLALKIVLESARHYTELSFSIFPLNMFNVVHREKITERMAALCNPDYPCNLGWIFWMVCGVIDWCLEARSRWCRRLTRWVTSCLLKN